MFLAVKEMLRSPVKFTLLGVAVSLLVFLILVQQALATALVTSFNGALKNQSAPVLVYATDALRAPQGSVITPDMATEISDAASVADSAGIGLRTVVLDSTRNSPDAEVSATLWGYQDAALGGPAELSEGRLPQGELEAVGSAADYRLGEVVQVPVEQAPDGSTTMDLTVVGLARDIQLSVGATLMMPWDEWTKLATALDPTTPVQLPNLVGVDPSGPAQDTIDQLRAASVDLDPLTAQQAADEFPGAAQVNTSFALILGLFGFVVPLVAGLFFLIITLQKSRALTLLRAVGSRSGVLVRSLLLQVLAILGGGIAVGVGCYALAGLVEIGSLQISFDLNAVLIWTTALLALGLLASLGAVRRVLAIDPIAATKPGGGR
ncbi:MAG: hypothetical protein WBL05_00180 [Brooklawnia sp.]|uniref:hypothetical protein n=1 Tax=Brooklawnia sp. TaxID=2699740 RepID=UPI003C720E3C